RVQTHGITPGRPFQTRSHRRNKSGNRQKRIASPGAGNCLLHDVQVFLPHRLRRPQRPTPNVLPSRQERRDLGRKPDQLPSPLRQLLVHLPRLIPTAQNFPTNVCLLSRSRQMVRRHPRPAHVTKIVTARDYETSTTGRVPHPSPRSVLKPASPTMLFTRTPSDKTPKQPLNYF